MSAALFGAFLVLMAIGVPIGIATAIPAMVGLVATGGWNFIAVVPQQLLVMLDRFTLLAVPIYILAGMIVGKTQVAQHLVRMSSALIGPVRGGLGMVVVVATIFFSGVSGSSSADTAAIGSITVPMMRKRGYPVPLSTAIVAAAGATAVLIPPVNDLVIMGAILNVSIAGLFAAGIVPGLLNGLAVLGLTYLIARRRKLPTEPRLSLWETVRAVVAGVPALMMLVIILGGIFKGIFTPTEAAAVAVFYGILVSAVVYRDLRLADLWAALVTAGRLTALVLFVVGMSAAFGWWLTFERVPQSIAAGIASITDGPIAFLLLVQVLFLLIGTAMDALPAMIVLMPILMPIAVHYGIHPIHFIILVQANTAIGFISPPTGAVL